MIVLDGALGTELERRGVATPAPRWSAEALVTAPDVVRAIHCDYAAAGATVHTACTFRTTPRAFGDGWDGAARLAVRLCRESVGDGIVCGSVAPLEDCWRPDLSPPDPGPEHALLAGILAPSVDVLLCETFANVSEALAAVDACVATGVPTWLSLTPGFRGDLLTPAEVREGAREAVRRGAVAVLVNCVPHAMALPWVEALAGLGVPFGAYANAVDDPDVERYLASAATWTAAGATLVGGCCGTGPDHVRGLASMARRKT